MQKPMMNETPFYMKTGSLIFLLLFQKMAWSSIIFPEEIKDVKSAWE